MQACVVVVVIVVVAVVAGGVGVVIVAFIVSGVCVVLWKCQVLPMETDHSCKQMVMVGVWWSEEIDIK